MKYYIIGNQTIEAVSEKEAAQQEARNRELLDGDPKFWDQIKWIFAEDVLKDIESSRRNRK